MKQSEKNRLGGTGYTCRHCCFYSELDERTGTCRANPPSILSSEENDDDNFWGRWAVVWFDDFCGSFVKNEGIPKE